MGGSVGRNKNKISLHTLFYFCVKKFGSVGIKKIENFVQSLLARVSSPLVGSPVESVIPIRWEDDKPC